jgi:hypothetical protein
MGSLSFLLNGMELSSFPGTRLAIVVFFGNYIGNCRLFRELDWQLSSFSGTRLATVVFFRELYCQLSSFSGTRLANFDSF